MLEHLLALRNEATKDGRFLNVKAHAAPGAADAQLKALAEVLEPIDKTAHEALGDLYKEHGEVEVTWQYLTTGKLAVGGARLVGIGQLTGALISAAYDYIPFDRAEDDVIAISAKEGRLRAYYNPRDEEDTFLPIEADFATYFTLLDACRGLFPWQKMLTSGVSKAERSEFLDDLKRVFPDAGPAPFAG